MSEPQDSFGRCTINPKFFDRFYEIFLDSHPAIRPLFKNTDFVRQKEALRTGLSMMVMHEKGAPVAKMALDRLRKKHGKEGLDISPSLYQYWIDSLVKAVKECDRNSRWRSRSGGAQPCGAASTTWF